MEKNKIKLALITLAVVVFLSSFVSALAINSVLVDELSPGQEGTIRVELENLLSDDVVDVSLILDFSNTPFIPVGTSEQSIDEIREDDEEIFAYRLKASSTAPPGDYEIPYELKYSINDDDKSRSGTIGVKIASNPDLTFSIETQTPVVNRNGKLTLKIVNKGFSDARFVSIKAVPEGFTILSEDEIYIGNIDSDDFETANFDVRFTSANANLITIVEYLDFSNKKVTQNVEIPLKVYTEEKAIELGIIQKSNTLTYIAIAIVIILIFIIWRAIKKHRRMKRSQRTREER
ncbi:hypothetical protein HY450_00725 [Candidatus Pacearchaeota archaeon]|nr:hypothetical protein [Candidatus Pacearchaeota archaeon]